MLQQRHGRSIATAGIALATCCVVSFMASPTDSPESVAESTQNLGNIENLYGGDNRA